MPSCVEHSSFLPPYPKTHKKGHAVVVELPLDLNDLDLSKEKIKKLRQAMQYSLTGGSGDRKLDHVPYFENEGDDLTVPMMKTIRNCAGVKV